MANDEFDIQEPDGSKNNLKINLAGEILNQIRRKFNLSEEQTNEEQDESSSKKVQRKATKSAQQQKQKRDKNAKAKARKALTERQKAVKKEKKQLPMLDAITDGVTTGAVPLGERIDKNTFQQTNRNIGNVGQQNNLNDYSAGLPVSNPANIASSHAIDVATQEIPTQPIDISNQNIPNNVTNQAQISAGARATRDLSGKNVDADKATVSSLRYMTTTLKSIDSNQRKNVFAGAMGGIGNILLKGFSKILSGGRAQFDTGYGVFAKDKEKDNNKDISNSLKKIAQNITNVQSNTEDMLNVLQEISDSVGNNKGVQPQTPEKPNIPTLSPDDEDKKDGGGNFFKNIFTDILEGLGFEKAIGTVIGGLSGIAEALPPVLAVIGAITALGLAIWGITSLINNLKGADNSKPVDIRNNVDYDMTGSDPNKPDIPPRGKAFGGIVQKSQPYLVGEKGPELMVPQSSGTIIPSKILNNLNNLDDLNKNNQNNVSNENNVNNLNSQLSLSNIVNRLNTNDTVNKSNILNRIGSTDKVDNLDIPNTLSQLVSLNNVYSNNADIQSPTIANADAAASNNVNNAKQYYQPSMSNNQTTNINLNLNNATIRSDDDIKKIQKVITEVIKRENQNKSTGSLDGYPGQGFMNTLAHIF